MKRTGKILVALLAVLILLMSMTALTVSAAKTTEPTKIYLTPNANWKSQNARFALYTWDGGDKWFDMTDADKDGVYECEIPAGIENIIFCRMNPNASANNWNNKWNQTSDLKYNGSNNHYTVKEGTWDKGGGTWSTFNSTCSHANLGPAATCTTDQVCNDCGDPVVSALGHNYNTAHLCTRCNTQAPFTVAGTGAHLGTEWDTGNTANDMTFADGVYTKVYENVAAGSYLFKVVRDHDWGTAYPSSDKSFTVGKAGSTVTITLTGTSVKVTVDDPVCTHKNLGDEATCTTAQTCLDCGAVIVHAGHTYNANHLCTRCNEQATFTVAGTGEHLGAGKEWWDATNEENNMTFADGVYTKVYENVAAGEYALKVVRNHDWSVAYPESDKSYTVDANGSKVTVTLTGTTVEIKVESSHQHVFVEGKCECGEIDLEYVEGYYLVGYINGADYGCEGDYANLGEYRFVDGQLSVKFNQDSYVFIKTANLNGESIGWFLSETYETDKDATLVAGKSEKLWLPGNVDISLTLTVNEDGTLTLVADYHTHSHGKVVTAPTCTEGGYTTYTCECGDTYTANEVAALGHDMKTDAAVAPTCTETGLTAGEYCTRCDHKVEQEEVPALGHRIENVPQVKPNCTESGRTGYQECVREGCDYETPAAQLPALGHDMVVDKAVDPTCTATGLTEGSHCTRCDHKVAQEEVPALGHDMVTDKAVAPTCTETGLTEGSHCSRCDHKVAQEEVPALGHDMVVDKAVAPTCTETGLTEGSHCSRCDHKVAQEEVDALGHNAGEAVVENKVAPNCTEDGSHDEVVYCTVCGDELSRNTVTDAKLNHKASDEWVKENEVAPTCENKGSYDLVLRCSVCGEELDSEKVDVDALGHKAGEPAVENSTAASCGAAGNYDEVVYCTVCDKELSRTTHTVDVTPHSYKATITANPSCTEAGVKTFTCSVCGDSYTEAIDALGHDLTTHEAKAPTCTAIGWDAYETCSRCDHTTYNELPKLKHSYEAVVTDPTCTATGFTTNTCSACGATYISGETSALGHDMVTDKAVAPTCTETGLTEGSHCSRCDHKVAQEEVAALGHDMVVDAAVAPTCTTTGLTEGSHCTRCDHAVAQEEVPALGHDMVDDAAVAPTCTETGLTAGSHCSRCDHKVAQESVPALGHDMVVDTAVAPTCTETGLTEGSHCSRCDHKVAQEEVPALGHDMVVDAAVAPTCTTTGLTEGSHCTRCDHVVAQEEVPALGHDMVTDEAVAPTCTETGLTEGSHCSRCDHKVAQEEVPALGHDMVVDKAVAPTCTETGLTEGSHCTRCDHAVAQEEVPATGHNFVNGKCECGEEDPNHVAPEQPDEDKPEQPAPNFFQRIWATIVNFFKSIGDFFANIFKGKK